MTIDLASLWDFGKPDESERRFRQALEQATGDDALILQTQIARAHGLRKDFEGARAILAQIAPEIAAAGPEVKVRHELELGRTYASATHAQEQQTPETKALARRSYEAALELARGAGLDDLAIDAIHMLAFVDTAPEDQLKWAQAAFAVVETSAQPAAKRWEASIRNNLGYALHQLGRPAYGSGADAGAGTARHSGCATAHRRRRPRGEHRPFALAAYRSKPKRGRSLAARAHPRHRT